MYDWQIETSVDLKRHANETKLFGNSDCLKQVSKIRPTFFNWKFIKRGNDPNELFSRYFINFTFLSKQSDSLPSGNFNPLKYSKRLIRKPKS